jgi:hypothetical protein
MKTAERIALLRELPYESKLGFVAFCLDRSLREARRHPNPRAQTAALSVLDEGLELLRQRAEQGIEPDPQRVERVHAQGLSFERPDPDGINMKYDVDVALIEAANTLLSGMRLLQNPNADLRLVAAAVDGPVVGATTIYEDVDGAREGELEVLDTALARLRAHGNAPFSRAVLDGIPDWTRGQISARYAAGRITGSEINQE